MMRQVIVIGGSMAGLLAARVLADYSHRVTVVERDRLPTGPEPRKGLPQARHVHILLWRGQTILERLFPGLQDELDQAGAPRVDWIGDACWYSFGGWAPRFRSNYVGHPCSRDLLEALIRQRLIAQGRIKFCQECEVTGLLPDDAKSHVTGIEFRHRDQPDQPHEQMQADLIVDASGRESRAPRWLEAMGYDQPSVTVVNSFLGYASCVYQKPLDDDRGWTSLLVRATPPASSRGGVINPIEHGRWMVTLGAAGRDYPPTDEAGFMEFARSLPVSTLYDALRDAEPLTPIHGYRKTENRWQHYEQLKRWPERFVVMGDAVCAFNPVYGQGMTSAAIGAATLDECLRDHAGQLDGAAHDFQKRLAKAVRGPWLLASGEDFRYPGTEGARRDAVTRLMHRYMNAVMRLANKDPDVFMTFFEVLHLLKPVTALLAPRIVARVLARAPARP